MKVNTFEVERVCSSPDVEYSPDGRESVGVCNEVACMQPHMWSVYQRLTDGTAKWLSDHDTFEHARLAAVAYTVHFNTQEAVS